jgi:hypothetical protein
MEELADILADIRGANPGRISMINMRLSSFLDGTVLRTLGRP